MTHDSHLPYLFNQDTSDTVYQLLLMLKITHTCKKWKRSLQCMDIELQVSQSSLVSKFFCKYNRENKRGNIF